MKTPLAIINELAQKRLIDVEAVVDKIEDGLCFLKAFSQKYDRHLMIPVAEIENLSIGNTLTVTQLPCYNVVNEAFSCNESH